MGSRTGSSYSDIAGKGRYITAETRNLTSSIENAKETASKEDYRKAAIIGAKILIHTNPGLATVYHTLRFSQKIIEWYPEIQEAYNKEGEEGVAKFLLKKACEVGKNVAISYAISEVADIAWDVTKSSCNLKTTPAQDTIAKFIMGETVQVVVDAARDGKPLDKDFVIKETVNIALDGFITSMAQSGAPYNHRKDAKLSPFNAYSKLSEREKKLLNTTIQEVSHEIAGHIYDEYRSKDKVPTKRRMKYLVASCIEEKYDVEIEVKKGHKEKDSYDERDVVVNGQNSGSSGGLVLSHNQEIDDNKISGDYKSHFHPDDRIEKFIRPKHWDLLNFATSLYNQERLMRERKIGKRRKINPKKITFRSQTNFDKEAEEILEEIATFLLGKGQKYHFKKVKSENEDIEEHEDIVDAICLFSGGLDSLAGYYWAKDRYEDVKCVFVNHSISKVKNIVDDIAESLGIQGDFYTDKTVSGGQYLQQTRGFLFLTVAAVYADIFKAKDVILSECGITKYLPNFSPADELTKTTHPFMIKLANRLYKKLGIDFELEEPFEDRTKAEIISTINDFELINKTHSCRTSNYMPAHKHDCGYCLNCLIKLVGLSYITGDRQEQFLLDPITNPDDHVAQALNGPRKLDFKKYESIFQLVNFCTGVLSGDGLHWSAKRSIERYGKRNLFKRFSEDIIYGLSFMKKRGMVENKKILELINNYESEKWFDEERINRRRVELLTDT